MNEEKLVLYRLARLVGYALGALDGIIIEIEDNEIKNKLIKIAENIRVDLDKSIDN